MTTISEKQLAANRANALKSTGPTSEQGKERSSQNAYRHGLTGQVSIQTDKDHAAFLKFERDFIADLAPEGAVERSLATSLAWDMWRLNRIRANEENYIAFEYEGPVANRVANDHPEVHCGMTQSIIFFREDRKFANLALYESRISRKFHKDMQLYLELKKTKPLAKPAEPLPTATTPDKPLTKSATYGENGFVFSSNIAAPAPEPRKRL